MRKSLLLLTGVLLALALPTAGLAAPLCMSFGTLSQIMAAGACSVGSLTFDTWTFQNYDNTQPPLPANRIAVNIVGGSTFSVVFSVVDGVFNSGPNELSNYIVSYAVHSPGRNLNSLAADLDPQSVATGTSANISLLKEYCRNSTFSVGCSIKPSLDAYRTPSAAVLHDGVTFASSSTLGIRDTLYLNAVGPSDYVSTRWFANSMSVPEPMSMLLIGTGLLGLGLLRRRMS